MITCSALTGAGLDALWTHVERHRAEAEASGSFAEVRRTQLLAWMWQMVEVELMSAARHHQGVAALERDVHDGKLTATLAARKILSGFGLE